MTLTSIFPTDPATHRSRRRLAGLGTAHAGPQWTLAVRTIRAAIAAARESAPTRRVPPAERIANAVIDGIDSLTSADRAVLAVVLGALLRHHETSSHSNSTPN